MEFSYYKIYVFPKHKQIEKIVPWIRVGIFNPKEKSNIVYPLGLIDSGSDLTIIHRELGEEIGFDTTKGKNVDIVGVGGGRIKGRFQRVGFKISDIKEEESPITYEDWVVFTDSNFPKSNPEQTAIWGTQGFFNHIQIGFEYPERIFIESQ